MMDMLWVTLLVFALMYGCDLIEAIIARIEPRKPESITDRIMRRVAEQGDRD